MTRSNQILKLIETNDRLGKCYQLSWQYISKHSGERGIKLVHGFISEPGNDRVIDHAWIEYKDKVFDPVMDQELPKDVYYRLFDVEVSKTYNSIESNKKAVETGVYGPWHKIDKNKVKWYKR